LYGSIGDPSWTGTVTERNRVFALICIMATGAMLVAGVAMWVLYRTAFDEERARLVEMAQSHARVIEAVARFDVSHVPDFPGGPSAATLGQIIEAHKRYRGFGRSGEFVLASRTGDQMVFLLRHGAGRVDYPPAVPVDSALAEPMRRALLGQSGTVVGLDYRGATVLAAYEPVGELDLGIVVKIDLAEVQAPFKRAGLLAGGFTLFVVLSGAALFVRITGPIITRLEERSRLLEETVGALMESETAVRASLDEKEVLLREIHHRVKNNMQVVSSLLKLQERQLSDDRIKRALRESQSRVHAMGLIHEVLYRTSDLSQIDLQRYVSSLVSSLVAMYAGQDDRVSLSINADGVRLGIDETVPCGLVINELISNSLKYAFPHEREGEIRIEAAQIGDNEVELRVSDNGVGIPPEVNFDNATTMGMRLVKGLVEIQLGGRIRLDREHGTRFLIVFERSPVYSGAT
jgi:two-component sensor histidine kinase